LHGDYRDPNSLNTSEELSKYTDAKSEILKRVLDEYGLIVCGWSAEWDVALRDAIYGTVNRRYAMYWAAYGEPTAEAKELIQHRGAQRIDIEGADEFFDSIGRNVEAIKNAKRSNPLSIEVLIERTKKLIPNESSFIELEELILNTSDAAYHEFTSEAFMSRRAEILLPAMNNNFTEEILDGLADLYFAVCEPTLNVLATLTRYGNGEQSNYIEKVLNNWLVSSTNGENDGVWRFLPIVFVIYTCGVVATNERKTSYLSALLTKPNLSQQRKLFTQHISFLEKLKETFLFPLGDHVYSRNTEWLVSYCERKVQAVLERYFHSGTAFVNTFDLFQMVFGLVYMYVVQRRTGRRYSDKWLPPNTIYLSNRSHDYLDEYWYDAGKLKLDFFLFDYGLFDSNPNTLEGLLATYQNLNLQIDERAASQKFNAIMKFSTSYKGDGK
jgi:hypothetical protein